MRPLIALVVVFVVEFTIGLILSPAAQPQNLPGKSATATAIVDYLNSLTNRTTAKLISGQHDQHNEITSITPQVNYVRQKTGKWVGIYAANLTTTNVDVLANITMYWSNGGLVSLVADPANPACELTVCSSQHSLASYTPDQLITPGTAINNRFFSDLDAIEVPKLAQLKNAGVIVLFRWMIEMDGEVDSSNCWTWWNCTLDGAHYAALFRQTHDYLVYTKGLNNLIWVMSFNSQQKSSLPAQYYPGSSYVDVVGEDVYMDTPSDTPTYNALLAFGKPVALTEFGPGNSSIGRVGKPPNCNKYYDYRKMLAGIKANFPKAVYFIAWGGCWSMYEQNNNASTMLSDPYVINRDALPLFSRKLR